MRVFEFECAACAIVCEQITRVGAEGYGQCPKCGKTDTKRQMSAFFTKGRGDVRETGMFHGCHTAQPGVPHDHEGEG